MTLDEWLRVARPAWMADAACNEYPVAVFFPRRGEMAASAKAVCASCLVTHECARYAEDQGAELDGVWAGTSPTERRRWRNAAA